MNFLCRLFGHKVRAVGHFMDLECVWCGAWDPEAEEKDRITCPAIHPREHMRCTIKRGHTGLHATTAYWELK